jgi:Ca2+-binding RTX toxin-like protein
MIMARFTGTLGNDNIFGLGTSANEFVQFGVGADTVTGGGANDIFRMSVDANTDHIDGRGGQDLVDYSASDRSLTISLGNSTQAGSVTADFNVLIYNPVTNTLIPFVNHATVATLNSIENVIGSNFADTITGNDLANTLVGGGGDDTLDGGNNNDVLNGGAGHDTLIGGGGSDWVTYADATIGMNIRLDDALFSSPGSPALIGFASQITAQGLVLEDTIGGVENVFGTQYDDVIRGNEDQNSLYGSDGNDIIQTRIDGFNDTIDGGTGNNTVDYSAWSYAERLTISLGEGNAAGQTIHHDSIIVGSQTVFTNVVEDTLTNIQNVIGGHGFDEIRGNSADNVLQGGGGADVFYGGAGADTMIGNDDNGNDPRFSDQFRSSIDGVTDVIRGGGGFDRVQYHHNLEDISVGVTVQLADGDGMGTTTAQEVAFQYINPVNGQITQVMHTVVEDQLYGIEEVDGSLQGDTLRGNNSDNTLFGDGGNDIIDGRGGSDTIIGGSGRDTLTGGAGADTFVFTRPDDSPVNAGDTITDFVHGLDRIDLRSMLDDTADLQALNFIGSAQFSGDPGELRSISVPQGFLVQADLDGDRFVDFDIVVQSTSALQASDFLLNF